MPYDMLVKLLTVVYSDENSATAKTIIYDTAFYSRDTPRLIKRKGNNKNISNIQYIVNIFLEMPPSSFPSYVAKHLSRLPPLTMNCFDIASLLKDIESLKIHNSILQESYETVVKALKRNYSHARKPAKLPQMTQLRKQRSPFQLNRYVRAQHSHRC